MGRSPSWIGEVSSFDVAVFLVCLLALGLRLWKIGAESYWADEWFSRWRAYAPALDSIRGDGMKTTSPLYYLLLKPWVFVFGDSEVALRLPSALAGALAIPLVARIGARLFDRATATAAALFMAVSAYHVSYSQEARMYSLVVLLGLLSTERYLACRDRASGWNRAGYIVSSAAILYTHYFGGFVLVAHGAAAAVAALRDRDNRRALVLWARDIVAVSVAFAPWCLVLVRQVSEAGGALAWIQMPTPAGVVEVLAASAGSESLLAVFAFLFLLGILLEGPQGAQLARHEGRWVLLSAYFAVPHLGLIVLSHVAFPLYIGRYAIAALPALYLGAAAGTRVARSAALRAALVIALAAWSLVPVLEGYQRIDRPQWREAVEFVAGRATGSDLIILSGFESRYYIDHNPKLRVHATCYQNGEQPDCTRSSIESHKRVWYLQQGRWELPKDLLLGYRERERREFARVSVVLFESPTSVVNPEPAL
jgi:uncharacterized membrane protein